MKVRATRTGYYNHLRRREGDVFTIADEPRRKVRKTDEVQAEEVLDLSTSTMRKVAKRIFRADSPEVQALADKAGTVPLALGAWMEPVAKSTPERVSTAQQAVSKASEEIKAGRAAERGAGGNEEATGNVEVI